MQNVFELFNSYPALFIISAAILSLIIGSFLNVVIYRLPKMMENDWRQEYQAYFSPDGTAQAPAKFNLATPRSACPSCNAMVQARDNIPVISWLLLKGKCRNCRTSISARYPLVEMLTAVMSAVVAWQLGFGIAAIVFIVITWALITLTF